MTRKAIWRSELLKTWQTMKLEWSKLLVYRVNLLMQVFGPALLFLLIKYSLWSTIYESSSKIIGGFTLREMLSYHMWVLVVSLFRVTHGFDRLSEEIRLGRISSFLLYPYELWEYHLAQYAARQAVQVVITCVLVLSLLLGLGNGLVWDGAGAVFRGVWLSLLGGFLWFWWVYIFSLLAFWLEETWTLKVIFQMVVFFLSGNLIPLSLYPEFLIRLLRFTPFPYMTYYPVMVFLGKNPETLDPTVILVGWTGIMAFVASRVWKSGIRSYTAAGM